MNQLRTRGTVPANLPGGLSKIFNAQNARYLAEADRYDPAALAARLPAGMPVLLTCADADIQVDCADVNRLVEAATGARAAVDSLRLHGVDHVLKEDSSRSGTHYDDPLPFSHVLRDELTRFVTR